MAPRPAAQRREVDIEEDRDDLDDNKQRDQVVDPPPGDDQDDERDEGLDNAEAARERREEEERRRAQEEEDRSGEDDTRLAYDLDADDDDSGRGASRRQRRNRSRKHALAERDRTIAALAQELAQLKDGFDSMSRGQLQMAAGDIDQRIEAEQSRLRTIDQALAKAVKEGDDATYLQATRLRDEARDRLNDLGFARRRLVDQGRAMAPQPTGGAAPQQRQTQAQAPDPAAVRYSEIFMDRHPWFDVNGSDEDSRIVKAIDDALADEGYRANTKQYWTELERRVRARGLGGQQQDDDMTDDNDDEGGEGRPQRRPAPRRNGGLPPRARSNGGGRPPGSNSFKLTQDMQDALDAEGLLDEKNLNDDQKKLRRKYVTQWKDGFERLARENRR